MDPKETVPQQTTRFPGYVGSVEQPVSGLDVPEFVRAEPPDWLSRHWQILAALLAVGVAWGTLSANVNGKLGKDEYAKDQAARAERQAQRDSVAGQTLTEVRRIGNYLCRKDPGAC